MCGNWCDGVLVPTGLPSSPVLLCGGLTSFLQQVFLPLTQGILWTLILSGWRFWNRETKLKGHSVGARIRRWWWGVNNWNIPSSGPSRLDEKRLAGDFTEVSHGS